MAYWKKFQNLKIIKVIILKQNSPNSILHSTDLLTQFNNFDCVLYMFPSVPSNEYIYLILDVLKKSLIDMNITNEIMS